MTLEIILYILLGFLLAVLLALVLAPVVWNRAVYLTERKVKATLPLTLSDVDVRSDRLRAEHAVTVRRLEIGIDDLRQKASAHVTDLHKKRDEVNKLMAKSVMDEEKIATLEHAGQEMREKLATTHSTLEDLTAKLDSTSDKLDKLETKYRELRERNSEAEQELSQARIHLVAKDAQIESLDGTLSASNLPIDSQTEALGKLTADVSRLKRNLADEKTRADKASEELETLKSSGATVETTEKLTPEPADNPLVEDDDKLNLLNQELADKQTKILELEAALTVKTIGEEFDDLDTKKESEKPAEPSPLAAMKEEANMLSSEIRAFSGKGFKTKKKPGKAALRKKIKALGEKAARLSNQSSKAKPQFLSSAAAQRHNQATLLERVREIQAEIKSSN